MTGLSSFQMPFSKILKSYGYSRTFQALSKAFYSRKSSSKFTGSYKVVSRKQDDANEIPSHDFGSNANWEFFSPPGFRFYMPGRVGPAWHDAVSTSLMATTMTDSEDAELECIVQDCPLLLRQAVSELFSGSDLSSCPLTVVSLSQKADWLSNEFEVERLTKQFMWAARDICNKLKIAGYWADFINPFSGVPCLSAYHTGKLYTTDERFRCLGFSINDINGCRVISNKDSRKFVGSLFTTAPASTALLRDLLQGFD